MTAQANSTTRADRTVGDFMALRPIVIRADAPLAEAARLMDSHRISGLPVVDPTGSLVGVVSQTDLVRARATEFLWANWPGLTVRHLMTSPAITIHRSALIGDAARLMERRDVHRLVVVSDENELLPIGILSTTDLVRLVAEETAGSIDTTTGDAEHLHA
jgi:CBS domain-containing protein